MSARGIGAITGFVIGLLICIVIFKVCNRNGKMKSEYDERQEAIRGRGYKYGFYTGLLYMAFLTLWPLTDIELPISDTVRAFVGIMLSASVMCVYSIWNDAYWGINNNITRYIVVFILATAINILVAGRAISVGIMIEDGIVQAPAINLLCSIMFLIIAGVLFAKKYIINKEDSDDGEES